MSVSEPERAACSREFMACGGVGPAWAMGRRGADRTEDGRRRSARVRVRGTVRPGKGVGQVVYELGGGAARRGRCRRQAQWEHERGGQQRRDGSRCGGERGGGGGMACRTST